MKKLGGALLAAMLVLGAIAPAEAHRGGHGFYGPVFLAPLLFPLAVAATLTVGVANAIAAPFAYSAATYAPAPVYAPPYAAPAYTAPAYAAPAYAAAPVYAPRAYAAASPYGQPAYAAPPPPPAPSYWYYCPDARAYYPYVGTCPSGWLKVLPR